LGKAGEGGEATPTIGKAGSKDLEVEAAGPASQDVNDLLRMSVSDVGAGSDGDACAGTCLSTVDEVRRKSGAAHATAVSCWMLLSTG
jgi:hypothetical protein